MPERQKEDDEIIDHIIALSRESEDNKGHSSGIAKNARPFQESKGASKGISEFFDICIRISSET